MTGHLLEDLNPGQAKAVAHLDGPAVILAGPGAGKTKTLTRRAAMLVQNGVPPEKIHLLTFSRASSKEMLARAKALDSRCAFIDGGNFNATATKIINQNIHVFGMDRPFPIRSEEKTSELKSLMSS